MIGREAFVDAIRRVRLVARDATTPARISLRSGTVQLSVITNDWGQAVEEVDAKYEGAEMTIAFNPQYLAEGVEAIVGDEVVAGDDRCLETCHLEADRQQRLRLPAHARASGLIRGLPLAVPSCT